MTGLWGWTDPASGREFVIAGHYGATSFTEITDPLNPRYLGSIPLAQDGRHYYRDIKVYQHYAFIVAEIKDFGLQVFDLFLDDERHSGTVVFALQT